MSLYAVIMAGGSGTRFWPRSRTHRPKQFLSIGTEAPLIVETLERLEPLIHRSKIKIVANAEYATHIASLLPNLPDEAHIIEPCPRNTAPCIGLAALHVAHHDPNAVLAVLPADHHIGDAEGLRTLIRQAHIEASTGHIVTFGIVPNRPETGYGYIETALRTDSSGRLNSSVLPVVRFVEKPDAVKAREYIESGRFLWNSGMFFFRCDVILDSIETHMPKLSEALKNISGHIGKSTYTETLEREFSALDSTSIDYGIMEPITAQEGMSTLKVIPVDVGWNDVGHWASLRDFAPIDSHGNVVDGDAVVLDCHDSVIQSDGGLIAAVGVNDLVIVKDGDVVMVCPKERAQDVRKLVEELKNQGRRDLV